MAEYLSVREVARRYSLAPSSVWRLSRSRIGGFPKPVKVAPQATRWRLRDLLAYDEKLAEQLDEQVEG